MATTVAPEYGYKVRESADLLEFDVAVASKFRLFSGTLIGGAAGAFAFIFLAAGAFFASGTVFLIGCLLAAITYWAIRFMNKKTWINVIFDKEKITVGGKSYLLSHVSSIGYDTIQNSPMFIPGGTAGAMGATAAMAARTAAGYFIYISYGTNRVPIIQGLARENVDQIYNMINSFLSRFGHHYG